MENDTVLIRRAGRSSFWLAGLGDQLALVRGRGRFDGVDDLDGTLAKVTDDNPVIPRAGHLREDAGAGCR